ncbi:MAG: hypothetical protein ACXAD7_14730 [Candidatus Kariarchaeaceae archaeon]|jgi:hypothetical protein
MGYINNKLTKLIFLSLILSGFIIIPSPIHAATSYIVRVNWIGWDFLTDNDCGDGTGNDCEIYMKVKYTTSSSCGTLSSWYGAEEDGIEVGSDHAGTMYSFSYSRVGSWPCLTFKVQFWEADSNPDDAATTLQTRTATSSLLESDLDLIIGSANGHFDISYMKYSIPYMGPES